MHYRCKCQKVQRGGQTPGGAAEAVDRAQRRGRRARLQSRGFEHVKHIFYRKAEMKISRPHSQRLGVRKSGLGPKNLHCNACPLAFCCRWSINRSLRNNALKNSERVSVNEEGRGRHLDVKSKALCWEIVATWQLCWLVSASLGMSPADGTLWVVSWDLVKMILPCNICAVHHL